MRAADDAKTDAEAARGEGARTQAASSANTEPTQEEEATFFVVGIGASAGGLEAIEELMRFVPIDAMSFIVVQHLAPDHQSVLPQLIARNARMQVVAATDGQALEPNRVYVIPPNADLAIVHGVIRVLPPSTAHGPRLPVDHLFRSLAEDRGRSAIGIVLSGAGTDGTLGLKAIKAAGGFTFVQDPSTAAYDGMPRSALSSGAADYCLPVKDIGEELRRIVKEPSVSPSARLPESERAQDQLGALLAAMRSEFGIDLASYKPSVLEPRVERRMTVHKLGRLDEYVRYVLRDRDELHALYKDMLVTVTNFFRDPEAFEMLKAKAFSQLFSDEQSSQPIRVWVPACATGEEAYSIAIALAELCEGKLRQGKIQVFGTDIDEESIEYARRGAFPANIALDVTPGRLSRFFVRAGNEFVISRRIRDMLVFSRHDILKDAPFARMDVVSCRNLLIYLRPSAQAKVLRTLFYALKPKGHLLLGSSETASDAPDLFSPVDRKNKIYVKKQVARPAGIEAGSGAYERFQRALAEAQNRRVPSLQDVADRKVLELYGPPGVVVNERLEILQFRGRTGRFLDPAPGAPSLNILKVARSDVCIGLKKALQQAMTEERRVTLEVTYANDGILAIVELDVIPVHDPEANARCFLVLFHARPMPATVAFVSQDEVKRADPLLLARRIHDLEGEVTITKQYLQTAVEEKESAFEELRTTNEELQSVNEELQSTNQELETSKEEMQAANEELTTLNEELQNRLSDFSHANDDLHNLLLGVDNPVVIVGMDLRIRRFTRAAQNVFDLAPGDVGRPVAFLEDFTGTGGLQTNVAAVIHGPSSFEREILAANHRYYLLRINPYTTLEHVVRGAVITLIDIDIRRRAAEVTRDVADYVAKYLGDTRYPLLIVDQRLNVTWTNGAFLSEFQLSSEELVGNALGAASACGFDDEGFLSRIARVFGADAGFRDYPIRLRSSDGRAIDARVGASRIPASTEAQLALVSFEPAAPVASGGGP